MGALVSILVPAFNAQRWIGEAIESALAQTWAEKEVVVVDDGSTDGTLDIVGRFAGRIRWQTGVHRGGNAARNRLLELSRGEWLQYLDADDCLLPEKIERQLAFVRQQPDCEVIFSPVIWEKVENNRRVWVETQFPQARDAWVMLARWELPQTGGPLFRRSALERVGGWRLGQPCCQEHELYFRLLAARCRVAFHEDCLAVYRDWDHGPRLSLRHSHEVDEQRLRILDRIEACLREQDELTAARRHAVNDARHRTARKVWVKDPPWAARITDRIRESDRRFHPGAGPSSPWPYLLTYRLLGFQSAQRLAAYKRALWSKLAALTERI